MLSSNFVPWLEYFPELIADGVHKYQELICKLRWYIEILRLEILLETFLLLSYLVMPQVGHLEQEFHIFGYLKAHPKRKLGFNPEHLAISKNRFQQCDWTEFYRNTEGSIPVNIPVARVNFMSAHCFVGTNHAGYTGTRRSQTGILLFCNIALIICFRKRQNSVEASKFGSEFTAMNN